MSMPDVEPATLVRSRTLDVAMLLFPDVEVLDFAGPFEVFSLARAAGQGPDSPILYRPLIIAEDQRIVVLIRLITHSPGISAGRRIELILSGISDPGC